MRRRNKAVASKHLERGEDENSAPPAATGDALDCFPPGTGRHLLDQRPTENKPDQAPTARPQRVGARARIGLFFMIGMERGAFRSEVFMTMLLA